ncbi:MAG: hypothetical protein H0V66_02740 [Bdellovibrionales bacterium]|nr:hypothetical protein [Bdellovibrionales bacterium]
MKTFLLALTLATSLSAAAQVSVYPTIFNFGNSAQVQIHNTTEDDISCSGTVYMHTQLGRMETGYYFDRVYKGSFSMRSFYIMDMNDRISYSSHSIFCHKVN